MRSALISNKVRFLKYSCLASSWRWSAASSAASNPSKNSHARSGLNSIPVTCRPPMRPRENKITLNVASRL